MKIYTRQGDDGTTGLLGNDRVSKADLRVDCIGTVDELNAVIGVAQVVAPEPVKTQLTQVQHELFTIGSHLAALHEELYAAVLPAITDAMIIRLECEIDNAEKRIGRAATFYFAGGHRGRREIACGAGDMSAGGASGGGTGRAAAAEPADMQVPQPPGGLALYAGALCQSPVRRKRHPVEEVARRNTLTDDAKV